MTEKLTETALLDLAKLAEERVYTALQGVTTLIENGRQAYAVKISVLTALMVDAANMLQAGMEEQNGKRPASEECYAHVLAEVAECAGLATRIIHDVKADRHQDA